MLTRNGSCVNRIVNTSAGSNGARRRHADPNGSPTRPFAGTLSVASAVLTDRLPDRLRCDVLALLECVGVLRRAGDHAREELSAAVADVLELRHPDVLHAGQAWALRRARIVDRG